MDLVRIANCSGFYGDRLAAAEEMVEGGPIDFLTGDYLAELTMALLWRSRSRDPARGYAHTFLRQMERVMGTCLERGIRVVSNAGGLSPTRLAEELTELADRLGLSATVATGTGDDLTDRLDEVETPAFSSDAPIRRARRPTATRTGSWAPAGPAGSGPCPPPRPPPPPASPNSSPRWPTASASRRRCRPSPATTSPTGSTKSRSGRSPPTPRSAPAASSPPTPTSVAPGSPPPSTEVPTSWSAAG